MTLVHALPAAKLQSNKNTHDIRKRNLYSLFFLLLLPLLVVPAIPYTIKRDFGDALGNGDGLYLMP